MECHLCYTDRCLAEYGCAELAGASSRKKLKEFALFAALGNCEWRVGDSPALLGDLCRSVAGARLQPSWQPQLRSAGAVQWALLWILHSQTLMSLTSNHGNSERIMQHEGDIALPNFKKDENILTFQLSCYL